jgi:hypothetical protein
MCFQKKRWICRRQTPTFIRFTPEIFQQPVEEN